MSKQRRTRSLCIVAGALFFAACGGDTLEVPPACEDEPRPVIAGFSESAVVRGSVRVRDRVDRTLDDTGAPRSSARGFVQADFVDLSTLTSTGALFMQLGDRCVGRVSRSQPGTPRFLDFASLSVAGTGRGTITAGKAGRGRFVHTGDPLIAGASQLSVTGTGTTATSFPDFTAQLEAPDPMAVKAPTVNGMDQLQLGDLTFEWTPGNGELVVIELLPDDPPLESGGQVLCEVADDGCFVLPLSAATFLLASNADTYTVVMERHRAARSALEGGAEVLVDASSEESFTLQNGALP